MTVRINEYYDVFDVKIRTNANVRDAAQTYSADGNLPKSITDQHNTNSFQGFSNWSNFSTQSVTTLDYSASQKQSEDPNHIGFPRAANQQASSVSITGQIKAPQAITNIDVLENGDILCYPPNVSVPHWDRIIFRNYDYNVKSDIGDSRYKTWANSFCDEYADFTPAYQIGTIDAADDSYLPLDLQDKSINARRYIYDHSKVPVFLKFDEYRSRSKVVFSGVDKTRNPDIEFKFGYAHGQMEPIKLNLSLSCNSPIRSMEEDSSDHKMYEWKYNYSLTRAEITGLLNKCYWSIEWIYDKESGN